MEWLVKKNRLKTSQKLHLVAWLWKDVNKRPAAISVAGEDSTAMHGEQLGKGHRLSLQCLLAPSQLPLWKVLQLLRGIHSHNKGGFQKQYWRVERVREKPKARSYTDSYSQFVALPRNPRLQQVTQSINVSQHYSHYFAAALRAEVKRTQGTPSSHLRIPVRLSSQQCNR